MIANYHTHTYRCGHAVGNEREYVEQGIKAGLNILGFSDHTPYDYLGDEPRNRPIRMMPEELPGYADSIRSLAEEYRDQIEIHLGVEAEYYPKYFSRLLEMLHANGVQYMVLGQHFLGNEIGEVYSGRPTLDFKTLDRYVSQTSEALETGFFTYFAHPDLIRYVGSRRVYEREMRKLCRKALSTDTPLELNVLGIREGRHYPNERFWRVVAEEGNKVILGSDAHRPEHVCDSENEAHALEMVRRLDLNLIETVPLRSI